MEALGSGRPDGVNLSQFVDPALQYVGCVPPKLLRKLEQHTGLRGCAGMRPSGVTQRSQAVFRAIDSGDRTEVKLVQKPRQERLCGWCREGGRTPKVLTTGGF